MGGGLQLNKFKQVHMTRQGTSALSPVDRQTDMAENIIFPHSVAAVHTNKFPEHLESKARKQEVFFLLANETPRAIYSLLSVFFFYSFDR